MPSNPRGRQAPGQRTSKIDRDTSKKKVAINKVDQRSAHAIKAFAKEQNLLEKEVAGLKKVLAVIKKEIADGKAEMQMQARFINQISKQFKSLQSLEKMVKQHQSSYEAVVDQPQVYKTVVQKTRSVPDVTPTMTYGAFAESLALIIVILINLLKLKAKKK